jgi:ribonucleoside-diphosphate reductase alpha chain
VLYREARKNERVEEREEKGLEKNVQEVIESAVKKACIGLDNVDEILLVKEIKNATYEGISEKDLAESMLMTARTLVEKEPNYSYVTARLLLNNMENEVGAFLDINERKDRGKMYVEALAKTVDKGIELDFFK